MQLYSQYRVLVPGKLDDIVCQPEQLIDLEDIHPGSLNSALSMGLIAGVEGAEILAKGQRRPKAPPKPKVEPDPDPVPAAQPEPETTSDPTEPAAETEAK